MVLSKWICKTSGMRNCKMGFLKEYATQRNQMNPMDLFSHGTISWCCWKKRQSEINRLKLRLSEIYYDNLLRLTEPKEGLRDWLDAVTTARIPSAVLSDLVLKK